MSGTERTRSWRWPALVAATSLALAGGAAADVVYLTNGRSFDGVLAQVEGDQVAIRMHQGVIRIPRSRVERIVRQTGPLEIYLQRRTALAGARDTTAADWLELAVWARHEEFASGYREAARRAATLDPDLAALRPVMLDLGYQRDGERGGWYTFDELMQRRGVVSWRGEWVTVAERDLRARQELTERRRLAEERHEDRAQAIALVELATAARVQAEAERARAERQVATSYVSSPILYTMPGWFYPVPVTPPGVDGPQPGGAPDGGSAVPPAGATNHGRFRASDWLPGKLNPQVAPPPGSLGSSTRP